VTRDDLTARGLVRYRGAGWIGHVLGCGDRSISCRSGVKRGQRNGSASQVLVGGESKPGLTENEDMN
jgi:hypothetical protein